MLHKQIMELAKTVAFRYLPAVSRPRYGFNLDPIELAALVMAIEERRNTPGAVVEIGVARGMTTMFLLEHLRREGIDKRLYAVDTFSSFTVDDLDFEVTKRGKKRSELAGFAYNDVDVWRRNLAGYRNLEIVVADCKTYDYAQVAPISVVLIDVDLYQPTIEALRKIWHALEPGGVIFVDDVKDKASYDGAYQAYVEFVSEVGLQVEIIGQRCGAIRKPR